MTRLGPVPAVLALVVTAGLTVSTVAPALAAEPSSARGARSFEVVGSGDGARYGICKEPEGAGWRVFARVDNRGSKIAHRGVLRNAAGTSRTFRAAPGRLSPVRSVHAARGSRVDYVLAAAQSGGGGQVRLTEMRRC
ncbi:hypothetical protein [Nocardioides litoris]|uniref:hypothetical protein n=1 Tax=Nocardioides litoris TaxID=1926648 RepID=UPI00111D807B|nr:hypothetical protein [Nocardioides litoris]